MSRANYTEVFNKARIAMGLKPIKKNIILLAEGLALPCGCRVDHASLSHFVVVHDNECKSIIESQGKVIVGDPNTQEPACVLIDEDTVALTNPWLGIFPYGV